LELKLQQNLKYFPHAHPGREGFFLFLGLLGDWQGGKMDQPMMEIGKTLLPLW
jgi:hypothetical protein